MGYAKLERNLIDIIKEEQAKLGFFKEDIRLYYPLSSLNHFFNSSDSADEMQMRLDTLPELSLQNLDRLKSVIKATVSVSIFHRKAPYMCMTTPHQMNLSTSLWN